MSVRAYRVIKIKRAEAPSWNLWHDDKLLEFFEKQEDCTNGITEGGGGSYEVSVYALKRALDDVEKLELDKWHVKAIKADIAFAKKHGDTHILYDCF